MDVESLSLEVIQGVSALKITKIASKDIASNFESNSIDLISSSLGSQILSFSDEFFAPASNLTNPKPPIHRPGVYISTGAWFDGWETRRHNPKEFDWVVIRLGVSSGIVRGVEIDTGFFSGNHAPEIAVQGCYAPGGAPEIDERVANPQFGGWKDLLVTQECGPACRQAWLLPSTPETPQTPITHVRLLMFPDGGIGRFRLYGSAVPVFPSDRTTVFDLAATVNGGVAVSCSDQHFGRKENLLLPGRGIDMGDGWETKRSRGNHVDWVIVRLGAAGNIDRLVVDTKDFKGNFPKQVQIFGLEDDSERKEIPDSSDSRWVELLPPSPCRADTEHDYLVAGIYATKVFGWVKMVIIPDGGVKRLRVWGRMKA